MVLISKLKSIVQYGTPNKLFFLNHGNIVWELEPEPKQEKKVEPDPKWNNIGSADVSSPLNSYRDWIINNSVSVPV